MSLYSKYINERLGDHIVETEKGFATYRILNSGITCYLMDIFVLEEFRQFGEATKLADKVVEAAKELGCTELLGSVVPSANNSTVSLKVLLSYGMSLKTSANDFIVMQKGI